MLNREPVMIAAAVRAVILAATAFGLNWTAEQVASVMIAVEAVLAVIIRQNVTSTSTLQDAGLNRETVAATAKLNREADATPEQEPGGWPPIPKPLPPPPKPPPPPRKPRKDH